MPLCATATPEDVILSMP
jgi:hypothetical protein